MAFMVSSMPPRLDSSSRCERLIPADAFRPGALGADVPATDRHSRLMGAGERLYRSEPWQPERPRL